MGIGIQTILGRAGYDETNECKDKKTKEEVDVNRLIETFTDMANRGTLLARGGVSQQDLLIQIIGTIVHVATEETV